MTKKILRALVFVIIILIIGSMIWIINKPSPLILQGEVETNRIDVASQVQGRVETFFYDVGDNIKKGERLLLLSNPTLQAQLTVNKAQLTAAKANKEEVYSTRPETIEAQKANVARAESEVTAAKQANDRMANLRSRGIASRQDYEGTNNKYKAALKAVDSAQANLDMAINGSSAETKMLADAQVKQAQAAYDKNFAEIEELTIIAPISGQIVSKIAQLGQLYNPGSPLFLIIDSENKWITFNIREDLLHDIKVGDEFYATIPALGNQKVKVTVSELNPQGQYEDWRTTKATGDFDLKIFEMRVKPTEPILDLRPGMSVNVLWNKP